MLGGPARPAKAQAIGLATPRAIVAALLLAGCGGPAATTSAPPQGTPSPRTAIDPGAGVVPLAVRLDDPLDEVRVRFKEQPAAGLLFDIDTGEVLWRRHPLRPRPIASLTKMLTAIVVDDRIPAGRRLLVSRRALNTTGSAVGLFKPGMRVGVSALLHGLLLPSGNDAARVLAEGAAGGSLNRFVRFMNETAAQLGLRCSRFATPSGLEDAGNHSCAADLAALARAVLRRPRLASIVARGHAVLRYPGKGGRLFLYNHNPLLLQRYRGITGVKTGFTDASGACFVATARRGTRELGVVLLDSPDIDGQARKLLDAGFAASA